MILVAPLSTEKRVFHLQECQYAKRIADDNKIFFIDKDEARAFGYRHCNCCSKLIQYYNQDKEVIDRIIISNSLKMYIEDDSMFIDNGPYSWKITTRNKDNGLILYHANTESYHKLEKKNGHLIHTYHLQKYKGARDIISYLNYIIDHDKWRLNNLDSYKDLNTTTKKQKQKYKQEKNISKKKKVKNVLNILDQIKVEEENKNDE